MGRISRLQWAKRELKPMPLLIVKSNVVKRYEWDGEDYECVGIVAKRISYDELVRMRIEILDEYNKQLKEYKNDDKNI